MWMIDRLANLITGLGTAKDKAAGTTFAARVLDRGELEVMYRGDWLARKIVDLIPFDMTREWRSWQAKESQIERLEATERHLRVRDRVAWAMQIGRLYGGAAIYIGTSDARVDVELDLGSVGQGRVTYLHVFSQHEMVVSGDLDPDVRSPNFGEPLWFEIRSGRGRTVRIHPSRVIRFYGAPLPDLQTGYGSAWSDSVLQVVYDAVQAAASAPQHVASLLPELKTDIVSVPGLSGHLATTEGTARVQSRFANANLIRSMHNVLLLEGGADKSGELWQQKQINFANFPELIRTYLQIAAGAADIPVTRLLGQAPAGLNATGDSDVRNYYDHVGSKQRLELAPRLDKLDEVLIRTALGRRPPSVHYTFNPLWQLSGQEKAEVALTKAETTQVYVSSGLIPKEVLARAARNQLVEDGEYPGIEAAFDEYDAGTLDVVLPQSDNGGTNADNVVPFRRRVADTAPRTLYIHRKVKNAKAILAWAENQGFVTTLKAKDLHVTLAYSRAPVDWFEVGESWAPELRIAAGGARQMARFGDATVLLFAAPELRWRHSEIVRAGASWDHPEYQPHITVTYGDQWPLKEIEPYLGPIVLGPEIFSEIDEDWSGKIVED